MNSLGMDRHPKSSWLATQLWPGSIHIDRVWTFREYDVTRANPRHRDNTIIYILTLNVWEPVNSV